MKADDAKRLRELERENAALKRIVADKELENLALGRSRRKLVSPSRRRRAVVVLQERLGISHRRRVGSLASTAPASVTSRPTRTPTGSCGIVCGGSPRSIPGGATGERTPCWGGRVTW
jgi:hypothetical protein